MPTTHSVDALVLALLSPRIAAHGLMNWPPSRGGEWNTQEGAGWCQRNSCAWFNQGCQIGCPKCTGERGQPFKVCETPMSPTLNDSSLLTYVNPPDPLTTYQPWRAPGFAPVVSPCGIAGGWPGHLDPFHGGYPPFKVFPWRWWPFGFDGRQLPQTRGTRWARGSKQEVSWSISANHGGGYAYRLCPLNADWNVMDEACFQRHHLSFAGERQWIQFGNDTANRTAIPAVRVTHGTNPTGSMWTRNPIPACSLNTGGEMASPGCDEPQFKPPLPGLFGFGIARCRSFLPGKGCSQEEKDMWHARFNFNIIDEIEVPQSLPLGDYLLSFRWDTEQNPQIWTNCADVTIIDASDSDMLV